nr:autophagy-related protein 9-like [Ziziphus jujuba var. spinosa]
MYHFFRTMTKIFSCSLDITDNKIQTMPWAAILEKKENYLIGMLNKGVLAFPISKWVPGAGPTVKSGSKGKCRRLILTKTLEWTLNWCILQSMFDRSSRVILHLGMLNFLMEPMVMP